jgi:hypothetical protein
LPAGEAIMSGPNRKRAVEDDWDEATEITQIEGRQPAPPSPPGPGFEMEIEDEEISEELLEIAFEDLELLDPEATFSLQARDREERWPLLEDRCFLGGQAGIPVVGSVLERAAEISWTSEGHILRSMGRRGRLRVNGRPMDERLLEPGDLIELARDAFVYEID